MSLLISTEQITEHLIWPFSTSTFKPGRSVLLPSAKLYAFPFPPLSLWKISGKKTLSINRIEIKLFKLVSFAILNWIKKRVKYLLFLILIFLRRWEKYECSPPIQLKVLSAQSKQMRIRSVGSRSRGPACSSRLVQPSVQENVLLFVLAVNLLKCGDYIFIFQQMV